MINNILKNPEGVQPPHNFTGGGGDELPPLKPPLQRHPLKPLGLRNHNSV